MCENSECSFSSCCFVAGDSNRKIKSKNTVFFNENAISCFSDNFHLLKYFPIKVPGNFFLSFNYTNETDMHISTFLFAPDKLLIN